MPDTTPVTANGNEVEEGNQITRICLVDCKIRNQGLISEPFQPTKANAWIKCRLGMDTIFGSPEAWGKLE